MFFVCLSRTNVVYRRRFVKSGPSPNWIAGRDPAIQSLEEMDRSGAMDRRVKPGDDMSGNGMRGRNAVLNPRRGLTK